FSSRRRHTSFSRDWSADVCSSDLSGKTAGRAVPRKSGVRTPESRGTYPRKPGWNNTKVEQYEGRSLPPARAEAAAPPRPRRSEEIGRAARREGGDRQTTAGHAWPT